MTDREIKRRRSSIPVSQSQEEVDGAESSSKTEKKGVRLFHCDYCRKDISSSVRIRCVKCSDFDLCLECFSVGVEVFSHKNDHPYRVVEHISQPVFDKTWGADEESLLLEGISLYGYGNWSSIADHVGTKSRFKCQSHYNAVFLNTPTGIPVFSAELADPRNYKKEKDVHGNDRRMSIIPPASAAPKKSAKSSKGGQDFTFARTIGYASLRGDFDVEHDNDAEQYIADMDICDSDTDAERNLKLKVLEIYNETLDERERRKKFILERDLLFPQGRKRSREEKIVYQNMSCFARFQTKEEHENFVQGLLNEQRIRKRIEQLQMHRLHGIKTLAEGERYEAEKKKRETIRREKEKLSYVYATPRGGVSGRRRKLGVSPAKDSIEKSHSAKSSKTSQGNGVLNLSSMEGFEKLSELERSVCEKLRLTPGQYFAVKDSLLNESYRRGFLRVGQQRQLLRVDINKTDRAFDFFISPGWEVNTEATKSLSQTP